MKVPPVVQYASSRSSWPLVMLAGILCVSVLLALFTPVFEVLFAWIRHQALFSPEGLVGMLSAVAVAAVALLVGRWLRAEPVSHHVDSFAALNPHPILEVKASGVLSFQNAAARALFPGLEQAGQAHPMLHNLSALLADLHARKEGRLVREVRADNRVFEQHWVKVPGTDRVRIYTTDITKRKHAAEAHQQSQEKFARVFRSAPVALSITRLSDGRFIEVNDSFLRLLGYETQADLLGRTAIEIDMWVHGTERSRVLELLSVDDATVHSLEAQVRSRDGAVHDVVMSVEMMEFDGATCVLSTLLDMTDHRRAETAMTVLKAFYENTLKELPIEVTVLDNEARFFYLNPEAMDDGDLRLWMVGKTSVDYALTLGLDPAPYERRHTWLLDVIARKEIDQIEETLLDEDGQEHHLLRVATPVFDPGGEVIYVVGYGIDITERKQVEQTLLEAKHAAEEMARLKSAFVANMSHEIRTPLTAIMGFATVLGEELGGEHRELVEIIKQSGERLLETLNSVLDLARLEANALEVDPKPLNLHEEVLAAARLYKSAAEKKGLRFEIEMPNRPLYAQLDRACLHRILNNLLSNAVKFTDRGEIRLALAPDGSDVHIAVDDTGIGIDSAFLPHIFEEFKQESMGVARTHTGSGLGLAITRHLVERMHGRIAVRSTKGEGTSFIVSFPAMQEKPICVTGPIDEPSALNVDTVES